MNPRILLLALLTLLLAPATADFTDADGDGFNNYQEYRCGTDPTNALSVLRLLPPAPMRRGESAPGYKQKRHPCGCLCVKTSVN